LSGRVISRLLPFTSSPLRLPAVPFCGGRRGSGVTCARGLHGAAVRALLLYTLFTFAACSPLRCPFACPTTVRIHRTRGLLGGDGSHVQNNWHAVHWRDDVAGWAAFCGHIWHGSAHALFCALQTYRLASIRALVSLSVLSLVSGFGSFAPSVSICPARLKAGFGYLRRLCSPFHLFSWLDGTVGAGRQRTDRLYRARSYYLPRHATCYAYLFTTALLTQTHSAAGGALARSATAPSRAYRLCFPDGLFASSALLRAAARALPRTPRTTTTYPATFPTLP